MEVNDSISIEGFYRGINKVIQDFIAPFYIYLRTGFNAKFYTNDASAGKIEIRTETTAQLGKLTTRKIEYQIIAEKNRLQTIIIKENNKIITAECID